MSRSSVVHEYDGELAELPSGYRWSVIRPRENFPIEGYQITILKPGVSIGLFGHAPSCADAPIPGHEEREIVLNIARDLLARFQLARIQRSPHCERVP
jgi:hypothetical protein